MSWAYRTADDAGWQTSWRKSGTETVKLNREEYLVGYLLVMCDNYAKYIKLPKWKSDYDVTFHPEGGDIWLAEKRAEWHSRLSTAMERHPYIGIRNRLAW